MSMPPQQMTSDSDGSTHCRCRRFEGKVAVITGSTAGIGLAIAERLADEGATVVVSSRKQGAVDAAVARIRARSGAATGIVCHVGSADHRARLIGHAVEEHGGIDVLVSNAVVNPTMGPLLDTPEAAVDRILAVNVKSALLLAQAAAPHLRSGAALLFVSSITAYAPRPPLAAYAVSKTALLGLVKALAAELGGRGIRVNGIAPGIVPTRFAAALVASDDLRHAQEKETMLGRLGAPSEIAGAAAFLLSSDAAYVTAETLVVAGGMASKL